MNTQRQAGAFRFELRHATRSEHDALDAHPAFAALMDGTLSLSGYARLMSLFFGFYARHDPILSQACADHALGRYGFSYMPRTAILHGDLVAIGAPRLDDADDGPDPLPPIASPGLVGGALYVVEGSMLGGAVLARAVDNVLARVRSGGDGYWKWCRDDGAGRWAMTCGMIEQLSATQAGRSDMVAGARLAFSAFGRWLDRWDGGDRPPEEARRC